MDHQEKDEIAIATKESRIDCQIRNIKASFNLQTFFSMYTKRKAASDYSLSEFGFGVSNLGVLAVSGESDRSTGRALSPHRDASLRSA